MWTVVLALFALAGCNQVLGLDSVSVTDGGIDAPPYDAPLPVVNLLAITPALTALAQPTGEAHTVPLDGGGPLIVQYGRMSDELAALETGTYLANGDVEIPPSLIAQGPWRFVYTFEGLPHEVQFPAGATTRRVVDLQMTPFDRPAVTAGTTLVLNPSGAPATLPGLLRLWVTNAWSETGIPGSVLPNSVSLASTSAIAGVKRAPGPNDDVILAAYEMLMPGNCSTAVNAAAFRYVIADTTVMDATPPSWSNPSMHPAVTVTNNSLTAVANKLSQVSGTNPMNSLTIKSLTVTPSGKLPLFVRAERSTPVGVLAVSCDQANTLGMTGLPAFAMPLNSYRLIGSTAVSVLTYIGSVAIENYIVSAATQAFSSTAFTLDYDIGLPQTLTVAGSPVGLTSATASIALPTTGKVELAWELVATTDTLVDAYQITLYSLSGATKAPVREYLTTTRPLSFDASLIQTGTYAFRIRALRGVPNAKSGAFDTWNEAQQIVQVWTSAFKRA